MKVKFNGLMETKKSGGCSSCGGKTKSDSRFVTTRQYILPSGLVKSFSIGEVEEVSEQDGQFLLSYIQQTRDGERKVFEQV